MNDRNMAAAPCFSSLLFIHIFGALALASGLFMSGCRTTEVGHGDGSDLESADARPWFDAAGVAAECVAPATSCPSFEDDKAFVDKCVESGFQAKTCGCGIRCSGKIDMPQRAAAVTEKKAENPDACPEASIAFLDETLKNSRQSFAAYKCATTHICTGETVSCTPALKQASTKVRIMANQRCRDEVLARFCPEQFTESLSCPENDIEQLSQGWKTVFKGGDLKLKACVQGVLCNDSAAKCDRSGAGLAKRLKASADRDGCEYWLKNFCSLGNSSL